LIRKVVGVEEIFLLIRFVDRSIVIFLRQRHFNSIFLIKVLIVEVVIVIERRVLQTVVNLDLAWQVALT